MGACASVTQMWGCSSPSPTGTGPASPGTCRNGDYSSHLSCWQSPFSSSSSGILSLNYASESTETFFKMQISGSGINLSPRSGSVALRWGQESVFLNKQPWCFCNRTISSDTRCDNTSLAGYRMTTGSAPQPPPQGASSLRCVKGH